LLNEIYQNLDAIAFQIGPVSIRWYGLGWVVGFLLAAVLVLHIARLWEIEFDVDAVLTMLIACMLGAVFGGRLGYLLFYNTSYFFTHPGQIFDFSHGGMSFHGGMIGLGFGLVAASRVLKMPLLTLGDMAAIGSTIGLGLVRIANFINGELWGSVTDLPWGVIFETGGPLPRHPTQLYEAFLEGVVLLAILYMLARRRPTLPRGSYFGIFLIGYGVFRIAIEFVRQPDSHIGYLLGTDWVTMGMLLSAPMIIGGAILLAISLKRGESQAGLEWLQLDDDDDGDHFGENTGQLEAVNETDD